MKRRLTVTQRQAITKYFCLLLGIVMLALAFYAIPFIAKSTPKLGGKTARAIFGGTTVLAEGKPLFSLSAGGSVPEFNTAPEPVPPETDTSPEPVPPEEEPEPEIPSAPSDEAAIPVFSNNLCWYSIGEKAELNLLNKTKFSVNLNDFLKKSFPIKGTIKKSKPLVLIVHTHGTESYLPSGRDYYLPTEAFRSHEKAKTVVHIGEVLKNELESLGIPVLHDETMYDKNDYSKSYTNANKGIKKILSENPSIKFVIDLHRDSVFDATGRNIKPLTTIDGKKCAQLMLVVGTNQGGANHPNWRDNLTVSTYLQSKLNELYPTLARPINLRTSAFNQMHTRGSVILEVGSCGNTIEEAENSAIIFAKAYAEMIKENMS